MAQPARPYCKENRATDLPRQREKHGNCWKNDNENCAFSSAAHRCFWPCMRATRVHQMKCWPFNAKAKTINLMRTYVFQRELYRMIVDVFLVFHLSEACFMTPAVLMLPW